MCVNKPLQGEQGDKGDRGLTTTFKGDQFPTGIIEGPPGPPGPAGMYWLYVHLFYRIQFTYYMLKMFNSSRKFAIDNVNRIYFGFSIKDH